ncbi:hypothetical protein CKAN_01982200 [Cinnamomum micranthum f. kanehirae]|uniref:Universal stress protein n=1 Tax=Cinnamomum micranthum f. kanehirae TaxID=337451 RepID=A0A3S3NML9_9MAGN|nr:hypothetical protein CKAN_01982200 [Cinnamomum micranthum f. kanehirae]
MLAEKATFLKRQIFTGRFSNLLSPPSWNSHQVTTQPAYHFHYYSLSLSLSLLFSLSLSLSARRVEAVTMAFARYLLPVPFATSNPPAEMPILFRLSSFSFPSSSSSFHIKKRKSLILSASPKTSFTVKAELQESVGGSAADAFTELKHVLLPVTDRNPYLSEGTRQAVATTASLAKKYGADITVVVIDDKPKESIPEHDAQLSSIRWHLQEGGFQEFQLLERLGEGKKPTAIIGEVADDLTLDLVVLSMEAIHSKHVDGNLLAEFIPCPVLLLPL